MFLAKYGHNMLFLYLLLVIHNISFPFHRPPDQGGWFYWGTLCIIDGVYQ